MSGRMSSNKGKAGERELNCYQIDQEDGSYYYAARSESDAVCLHMSTHDIYIEDCDNPCVYALEDDHELTIGTDDEDGETKTVREWIEKEGRGCLAVPMWLYND